MCGAFYCPPTVTAAEHTAGLPALSLPSTPMAYVPAGAAINGSGNEKSPAAPTLIAPVARVCRSGPDIANDHELGSTPEAASVMLPETVTAVVLLFVGDRTLGAATQLITGAML